MPTVYMTTVYLCPTFGCGFQAFTQGGVPLTGGLIYTYAAGTTTPLETYTTSAGTVQNDNPVVLDAGGRPPSEIWLTGVAYALTVTDSLGNVIRTFDNISGIMDDISATTLISTLIGSAINTAEQNQTYTNVTTSGTPPNYILTPPVWTSYAAYKRMNVVFHASGAGADQGNVSGLGNKAFKQYDASGAKIAATIVARMVADVVYDGTDLVILDSIPSANSGPVQIFTIGASVASSALTITAPTTSLDFRSGTLGTGTVTPVSGDPADLVIPSTATLGTTNAVLSRLMVLAINNAGTIELAVVNNAGGIDLTETGLISTTAISAAATADNIVYSTTARTGVVYRVIGWVESTQATAGTWATAPSTIQGAGGQALTGGAIISALGYTPLSTDFGSGAVGSVALLYITAYMTTVANNATIAGSGLSVVVFNYINPILNDGSSGPIYVNSPQTGTWRNVSGVSLTTTGSLPNIGGLFQRIA
jgi:hypothetical protein